MCWCRFKLSFVNNYEKYACSSHLWRTCLWWEKTVAVFKKGISGFEEYNLPLFWCIGRCFADVAGLCSCSSFLLLTLAGSESMRFYSRCFVSLHWGKTASCLLCCGTGARAWGRCVRVSDWFWAVNQRRRTTGQTSYMSPVTAKSPVTAAEAVTRQWQSFSHAALNGWQSFMVCGQAGLGWATLKVLLWEVPVAQGAEGTYSEGWDKHHMDGTRSNTLLPYC